MITKEQAEAIKKQIIGQIEKKFPEDRKEHAIKQIISMDEEELEEFLKQNNLIKNGKIEEIAKNNECIFCSIAEKSVESHIIDENEEAIAVLEINPISKAHTLIIPKKHISSSEDIPKSAFAIAKKISKKIKEKFKPKEVEIYASNIFGHEILNILPIYSSENKNSKRSPVKKEELEILQKELEKKKSIEKTKKQKTKVIENSFGWLP